MMPMTHLSLRLASRSRFSQSRPSFIGFRCIGSSSSSSGGGGNPSGPVGMNKSTYADEKRWEHLQRHNINSKPQYVWEIPTHHSRLKEKSKRRGNLYIGCIDTSSVIGNENRSSGNARASASGSAWSVVKDLNYKHQDTIDKDGDDIHIDNDSDNGIMATYHKTRDKVLHHLLPAGYPTSVQPGYAKYISYCFLANTASTITMVLSTQTLLLAIGVGTQHAAPISATLNWIIKDGIGQFGGILFASKISVQTTTSIDSDPKRWRMVSALAMDCAMMMELATIAFPSSSSSSAGSSSFGSFLLLASVANIGKNIAFLTASASRAKLHQSLTKKDNLGDVTGKATSQSIVASLIGTGIGIVISPLLLGNGGDLMRVGVGCFCLAGVHQYCTYKSLKSVALKRLNRHRLEILLSLYLQDICISDKKKMIDPEQISVREYFLPLPMSAFEHDNEHEHEWLYLGCGVRKIAPGGPEELSRLCRDGENYVLNCFLRDIHVNRLATPESVNVCVTFFENASGSDMLRAMFQAASIRAHLQGKIEMDLVASSGSTCTCTCTCSDDLVASSYKYMDENIGDFLVNLTEAGWSFDDDERIALESSTAIRLKIMNDEEDEYR